MNQLYYGDNLDILREHITQLSILLTAVEKMQKEPRRIGFRLMQKIEEDTVSDGAGARSSEGA